MKYLKIEYIQIANNTRFKIYTNRWTNELDILELILKLVNFILINNNQILSIESYHIWNHLMK